VKAATSALVAATALLAACTSLPGARPLPAAVAPTVAAAWQAPLPPAAATATAADHRFWWAQFDDPLLPALIDSALAASPSVSSAANRIAQARATRVAAAAVLVPQFGATAGASRGRIEPATPTIDTLSAGLQASWELDVFGAGRAGRDAAQARLEGTQAAWQGARIAVAAETATSYLALRACEAQLALTALDSRSRTETARLTELTADAGFRAPADAALARASAAQGRNLELLQRARCEQLLKGLVALTARDEAGLRGQLSAGTGRLPQAEPPAVTTLPAALLQQRPDLAEASRQVAAAAADEAQRVAQRWPQVSLSGSVGGLRISTDAGSVSGSTWSLGPLTVSLPIFDAGRRAADVVAARAAYDDAVLQLQAGVRNAVREVEDALVQLDSTGQRRADAAVAAEGFEASLRAAEARYRTGLGSLFELEDARRSALLARAALVELERDRAVAVVALYRALGGGWNEDSVAAATPVR
jgi:NodT family efflux transporter outer membrane factor (OMF) lipoprotein